MLFDCAPHADNLARQRARQLSERHEKRFPKAIEILRKRLKAFLTFYAFPVLDARKIPSLLRWNG